MIDFSTKYMGLKLKGPIVVSSTPLSESIDNIRRMEDSGAAAVVLTSLFEEQLELESKALDEDGVPSRLPNRLAICPIWTITA
jgi:dihydroorotate dehydrogenase (fumarate)